MNFSMSSAVPTTVPSGGSSVFSLWAVLALVVFVFIGLVVYYATIGYTVDLGWSRLFNMFRKKEDIDIDIGLEHAKTQDYRASLRPDTTVASGEPPKPDISGEPPKPDLPPVENRANGMPGAEMEDNSFMSFLKPKKQIPHGHDVFNVSKNIYTFHDAPAVCAAMGAEMATYEQVEEAYKRGADWCNYGWVKGQMAVYPTQKETYQKLQKGSTNYHNACGRPGVNGGFFDNPELLFGVNCIGKRPEQKSADELRENDVSFPKSAEEIEFDKKVQKFRDQLDTTVVLPFNKHSWTG